MYFRMILVRLFYEIFLKFELYILAGKLTVSEICEHDEFIQRVSQKWFRQTRQKQFKNVRDDIGISIRAELYILS